MVGSEGQSPGLRGEGWIWSVTFRATVQSRTWEAALQHAAEIKVEKKKKLCKIFSVGITRFIDAPQLLMCLLCHVANRVGKSFTDSRREQLEVHNSLSVKMESATPFSWSVSFLCPLAGQGGLRQHLCKFPAFVSTWNGFTWLLVNPAPPMFQTFWPFHFLHHTTPLHSTPTPPHYHHQHLFPQSYRIPPVTRADRHSSSAGTLARVDQVSHLPGDCAAYAHLWLSAAHFSSSLVCCYVR